MGTYIRYIDRTREYYLAEGYNNPYKWAHFEDVPFTVLDKPLSECRITIVTSSEVKPRHDKSYEEENQLLVGNVYDIDSNLKASDLCTGQILYDRYATNMDDIDSFFPVTRVHEVFAEGRVGSIAPFFHGLYTSYSQRKTRETDALEVLKQCRENGVDAAILTPV
ncbi:MAG: glycine/sarcosine/betaine reductase selenoprotein B family protein [Thermodesulfobacteriota bacterium]|nr:glycine/sarcosine/betaine reductase selenoprotein B family protein [Thermodesulfobacteriota bacterium]